MKNFKKVPKTVFDNFGIFFPYSTVDVIIRKGDSFLLTKRSISPYKNKWHIPGGVVFKTERLQNAAKRIAKEELNLNVKIEQFLGTYENPVSVRHDISHVFLVSILSGKIVQDFQSSVVKFFRYPPKNIVPYQHKILVDALHSFKK